MGNEETLRAGNAPTDATNENDSSEENSLDWFIIAIIIIAGLALIFALAFLMFKRKRRGKLRRPGYRSEESNPDFKENDVHTEYPFEVGEVHPGTERFDVFLSMVKSEPGGDSLAP